MPLSRSTACSAAMSTFIGAPPDRVRWCARSVPSVELVVGLVRFVEFVVESSASAVVVRVVVGVVEVGASTSSVRRRVGDAQQLAHGRRRRAELDLHLGPGDGVEGHIDPVGAGLAGQQHQAGVGRVQHVPGERAAVGGGDRHQPGAGPAEVPGQGQRPSDAGAGDLQRVRRAAHRIVLVGVERLGDRPADRRGVVQADTVVSVDDDPHDSPASGGLHRQILEVEAGPGGDLFDDRTQAALVRRSHRRLLCSCAVFVDSGPSPLRSAAVGTGRDC